MSISYKDQQLLTESKYIKIFRATRISDNKTIILKSLKIDFAAPKQMEKLQHEYDILTKLSSPWVIKPIDIDKKNFIIILEDLNGCSLLEKIPNLDDFELSLKLAIELARGLGDIHHQRVIHKDINPQNILVYDSFNIKYIDFGISSLLSKETQQIANISAIEGTLAYISPEQTGRINHALDYRSDIYSLGVTLYHLFTKQLPFNDQNPLDLIHAHIAREPVPPHHINPKIPVVLSNIIMKCISKTPEKRYRGAFGLKADLTKCLNQLVYFKQIEIFELAEDDVLDHFELPSKLYGRTQEIKLVQEMYERISRGKTEVLLLQGAGGIGKTSLINEIEKSVIMQNGRFVKGEFAQFKKHIPFHGVIEILKKLVAELLLTDEATLSTWRSKILTAVGDTGQLLIDIVPQIKLIIGEQPPLPKVGPEEILYRFNYSLANFLEVFLSKNKSLVICLENIQWADEYSLKFFEYFLSSVHRGYFLFVVSYRESEITPIHPFSSLLEHLRKLSLPISTLMVEPLKPEIIEELIHDSFKTESNTTKLLAELTYKKTQGNPFFLGRFLKLLYQDGLFEFDPILGRWNPQLEKISTLEISDNVAEILSQKINTLEQKTQELLKIGAAIGHAFDLDFPASLQNISKEDADKLMFSALEEELVSKYTQENGKIIYSFVHDRVQQAANSLIKAEEKSKLHFAIAKKLLEITPHENISDKIIDIVDHFNEGIEHVTEDKEKELVCEYNFLAGERAKNSAEFSSALNYFHNSLKFLKEHDWENKYTFCTELYLGLGLSERMAGNKSDSEAFFDTLLSHTKTKVDKSRCIGEKMLLYMQELKYEKALKAGFECLKIFGYHYPEKVTKSKAILEYLKTKILTIFIKQKDICNLPPIDNKEIESVLNLLGTMIYNAYLLGDTMLSLYLILKMYQLTLKYGISEQGVLALSLYAAGLSWIRLGQYEQGFELGQIALTLSKRYQNSFISIQVPFQVYLYSNRWRNSLRSNVEPFKTIVRRELELGNVTYAGNSAAIYLIYSFLSGTPLSELLKEVEIMELEINKLQIYSYKIPIKMMRYFALSLQSKDLVHEDLSTTDFPEELISAINEGNYKVGDYAYYHFLYTSLRIILLYYAGNYAKAEDVGKGLIAQSTIFGNNPLWNSVYLYYSLAACELYKHSKDKSLLKKLYEMHALYKRWSQASSNYIHGYHLLSAELAKIAGNDKVALSEYLMATNAAKAGEFLHEEALCQERLTYYYLDKNDYEHVGQSLVKAVSAYRRWEARGKVEILKSKFATLMESKEQISSRLEIFDVSPAVSYSSTETIFSTAEYYDLATFIDASQTISKEIVFDKLVQALMHIVTLNAGASKALFILNKNGELFIQAEFLNDKERVFESKIPLEEKVDELCTFAVNRVARTHEFLVINEPALDGNFRGDPYIKNVKTGSIAVIPLTQQAKLTGLIYLENTSTVGAFKEDRLKLIQVLSTQMAIAIENAQFYAELEEKVNDRTLEIRKKNEELSKTLNILQLTQEQLVIQEKLKEREMVKNKLGRYIPNSQLLEMILNQSAELANVEKEVTILFFDIRDFTTLSERLPPEDTVKLLNQFFTLMVEHVIKNHGILDKFMGDAFMAIFGAFESDSQHPLHAVKAAIDMHTSIDQFNKDQIEIGRPTLKAGIGINTGTVLLGNIGSQERIEYTAIGDAVNIASRVESLTKRLKSDILITESTYLRLNGSLNITDRGSYALKGKQEKSHIYKIER